MEKIIIIVLGLYLLNSCTSKVDVFQKENLMSYTEEEFNLLNALEFIKSEKKDCNDTCFIWVDRKFSYFDTCLFHNFPLSRKKYGYDSTQVINISGGIYKLEGVGEVFFYNRKENEKFDYKFSPIVYNNATKPTSWGQVLFKNGKKMEYTTNLIKDNLYFSSAIEYYSTCDYWY